MKLNSLKATLRRRPGHQVRFVLPDGSPIPADFHITEVGHVKRTFVDCGGTVRQLETCLLQAWVAEDDPHHRLAAAKMARILEASARVLPSDDLEVELEYQAGAVAQYQVGAVESGEAELRFRLAHKRTDCRARGAGGLPASGSGCGGRARAGRCG